MPIFLFTMFSRVAYLYFLSQVSTQDPHVMPSLHEQISADLK